MALRKLMADLSIISKLGNNPGVDNGLSEEQIKAKFDEAANIIKDYLNNYLILEIEKTVDVESLLADILDKTLSKEDKAANARAVGDAVRGIRAFFERVVHGGDYVLESDGCFAAEVNGAATVRIMGGEGVMQGNLFALNLGEHEDVKLTAGTYGLSRNDLIVVRCTKGEADALSYALVGLTGNQTSGEPVDPEYTQSDINADGTVLDFPLYRIKFDGTNITEVVPLFEAEKPINQYVQAYFESHSKRRVLPASLLASGWTTEAPYSQTILVEGVLENDTPHVAPVYSDVLETSLAQREAWAMVCDANTSDGAMSFRCFEELPTVDIPIQIEVNR